MNQLCSLVTAIRDQGHKVPRIQISRFAHIAWTNAFDGDQKSVIRADVATGMHPDGEISAIKALVEYFERQTFYFWANQTNHEGTLHSDGFAAYPAMSPQAGHLAKQYALNEAMERYAWATWWDSDNVGHSLEKIESTEFWTLDNQLVLKQLNQYFPFKTVHVVQPLIHASEKCVILLFAENDDGGFISGGAAGNIEEASKVFLSALVELIRHGLAMDRFMRQKIEPTSFYENRLLHFGVGRGTSLVKDRLNRKAEESIAFPRLVEDRKIEGPFQNLVTVHRCLFENQPPFVSGELERLCL